MRNFLSEWNPLQKEMARMLHWGSQGIGRNLRAAAEYYRMGAEEGQGADPVANYDYGVVLLRVRIVLIYFNFIDYLTKIID